MASLLYEEGGFFYGFNVPITNRLDVILTPREGKVIWNLKSKFSVDVDTTFQASEVLSVKHQL